MNSSLVLVVSIDGVAPRFVDRDTMPVLCRFARQGASTFDARTVRPAVTVPAHASLLRGVSPSVHGITDNDGVLDGLAVPTWLGVARAAGHATASLVPWRPVDALIEADASLLRICLDSGYSPADDARVVELAATALTQPTSVAFAYLVSPDLAGHDHGWGSKTYTESLKQSDRNLGRLLDALPEHATVIVTTDHGGHGKDHGTEPIDEITFVAMRGPRVAPMTTWHEASILDVAPTVADLIGTEPAISWEGTSLLGRTESVTDVLMGLLGAMADVTYGERVTMLEHSLQTAALAHSAVATDDVALAALLHDVGHLLGDAGRWGLPDHAELGAYFLQQWLPRSVTDPIRLHVDAKRYLVTAEPSYAHRLSQASVETLREQGGPFEVGEAAAFAAQPWSDDAVALRRFDDDGKVPEAGVAELESWRPLIERFLALDDLAGGVLRDLCNCAECVDAATGQHLLDVTDLDGWQYAGRRGDTIELTHPDGRTHTVHHAASVPGHDPVAARPSAVARHDIGGGDIGGRRLAIDGFVTDLVDHGLAVIGGLAATEGQVLEFAAQIGFVRETNYGRLFDVRSVPEPNNLAYTPLGLPLHTDNPYRDPTPSVQLLHCIQPAASGGDSLFSDGFAAAERLRASNPEAFEILVCTPIRFRFADAEVDLEATKTMITLGPAGEIAAVHVNHRSMVPTTTPGFVDAYRTFAELLREQAITVRLGAGDLVGFDNRRILHARTGFDAAEARHLQGCYIDIDALRSTRRRDHARQSSG